MAIACVAATIAGRLLKPLCMPVLLHSGPWGMVGDPSWAPDRAEPRIMSVIHFVGGVEGGIGKSVVARVSSQYFPDPGRDYVDPDDAGD